MVARRTAFSPHILALRLYLRSVEIDRAESEGLEGTVASVQPGSHFCLFPIASTFRALVFTEPAHPDSDLTVKTLDALHKVADMEGAVRKTAIRRRKRTKAGEEEP